MNLLLIKSTEYIRFEGCPWRGVVSRLQFVLPLRCCCWWFTRRTSDWPAVALAHASLPTCKWHSSRDASSVDCRCETCRQCRRCGGIARRCSCAWYCRWHGHTSHPGDTPCRARAWSRPARCPWTTWAESRQDYWPRSAASSVATTPLLVCVPPSELSCGAHSPALRLLPRVTLDHNHCQRNHT